MNPEPILEQVRIQPPFTHSFTRLYTSCVGWDKAVPLGSFWFLPTSQNINNMDVYKQEPELRADPLVYKLYGSDLKGI